MWRGGLGASLSVPGSFVCRCLTSWNMLRFHMSSRPGEFRPQPLTDPSLTVSGHTAGATRGRLAPSAQTIRFLRYQLTHVDPDSVTHSLRFTRITPSHRYYGAVRACSAHRYCQPRGASAWAFSLSITDQVLKFRTKARMRVTPPITPDIAWPVSKQLMALLLTITFATAPFGRGQVLRGIDFVNYPSEAGAPSDNQKI